MQASEISRWMVSRLAAELEVPEIQVKTSIPLLSLGLDSLKLLSIAGELAEFINQEVSADAIWDHDSIDSLSAHLAGSDGLEQHETNFVSHADDDSQKHITIGGKLQPLVVIIGGMNFGKQLATFVPPNATTAWRKLDFLYSNPEVPSVDSIAESIVDSLDKPHQHRSVVVAGYSIGALIGLEVAQQLSGTCDEVRLVMVEPPVVGLSGKPGPTRHHGKTHLSEKLVQMGKTCLSWVLHPQATMRRFGLRCKRELLLRPYAKIVLALGGDLPVATRAWWYFRRTVKLRVIQYEFETYVGRTLLIGRERWLAKYSDGWSEVLVGPTSTFPVTDENTHRSLEKEGMKHWGGVMQQLVQEADAAANDPDPKFLETSRSETQPSSRAA